MPDPQNSTEAWREFLEDWMARTGASQYQLALSWGIGQGLISKWLHPDPERRTVPAEPTLKRISARSGMPLEDLYRMTGRDFVSDRLERPQLRPEVLALLRDIERRAPDMSEDELGLSIELTGRLWGTHELHRRGRPVGRGRSGRGQNSDDSAGRDKSKMDYSHAGRNHSRAKITPEQNISAAENNVLCAA